MNAQERRKVRLEILEEFKGNYLLAAVEAVKRGLFSPKTNMGDVRLSMMRTWILRNRGYRR